MRPGRALGHPRDLFPNLYFFPQMSPMKLKGFLAKQLARLEVPIGAATTEQGPTMYWAHGTILIPTITPAAAGQITCRGETGTQRSHVASLRPQASRECTGPDAPGRSDFALCGCTAEPLSLRK